MNKHEISSAAFLRKAAWSLYREPVFAGDQAKRQANINACGAVALCGECAGTGNALLFIYMECRACRGTGLHQKDVALSREFQLNE